MKSLYAAAFVLHVSCSLGLAHRTGSEACWAELPGGPEASRICVSHRLWLKWLEQPGASAWCGSLAGRWQTSSPLENSPDQPHQKRIVRTWKAESLPQGVAKSDGAPFVERKRERISEVIAPHDPMGVFRSILLGERNSTWPAELLRLLGFVHLLSATGIHLYALSRLVNALVLRVSEQMRIPAHIGIPAAGILSFLCWSWAWLLAGGPAGMLRPWILICLKRLARGLGVRWRTWSPLALALGIDIGAAAFSSDSFTATLLRSDRIFYALAVGGGMLLLERKSGRLRSALQFSIASWAFAAVWEIWRTGLVAIATPVLSLITVPIFCTLLYPWLIVTSMLSTNPLWLNTALLASAQRILDVLSWVALRSDSLWVVSSRKDLWVAAAAGLLWAFIRLSRAKTRNQILAGLGILATLFALRPAEAVAISPRPKAREVEQLDVGQGDGALIRSDDGRIGLIDAGSQHSLSATRWIELLAQRGITRIDWVSLSHLDEDHIGGLLTLSRLLPIGCVTMTDGELATPRGELLVQRLTSADIPIATWNDPRCVPFEGFEIRSGAHSGRNENMGARLIPLESGGTFLTEGDASAQDEETIARWAFPKIEPPLVLKISHHGSKYSTDEQLLRALKPKLAIISSGIGNRYGHPTEQTLEKIERAGIPFKRTDSVGSIRAGDARRPR